MKNRITKRNIWIAVMALFLLFRHTFLAEAAIRTGGVEIELECYEETEDGRRIPYKKIPELMPGEETSYVITVKNIGSDVWVRLHISIIEEREENGCIDEKCLMGIDSDWTRKGEYWYYLKPLKSGMQIDFCKGIRIPDFEYMPNGMSFTVYSKAEAIQAANTMPDFSREDPFGGLLIEGSAGQKYEKEMVCGIEVRYENGAETIVDADRLFDDINEWMPGDFYSETIVIKNRNPMALQVTLKEVRGEVDEFLWNALQLTIRRGNKTVYDGGFSDNALRNGIVLGTFRGNSEETLEFEVSLSEDETNRSAFQEVEAIIYFSVQQVEYDGASNDTDESEEDYMERIFPYPDPSIEKGYSGGKWKLTDEALHKWEYLLQDGSKAKDGWMYLFNPYSQDENKFSWFCFDVKGVMQFGWIRTENGNWYFCHERSDGNLGKLKHGWHHDKDDQRTYYLDPVTGIMQTGWRKIGDHMYYFTPLEQTNRQNWFWNTEIGRWLYDFLGYRTYGSMYCEELTPDGYYVDENGVWNGHR